MDGSDNAVSRVLVLSAERETRRNVLHALLQVCDQDSASDLSQGVHPLALTTKYYTADLEVHVHAVEANELLTPLAHDADQYEALLWLVDATSDRSFVETQQFISNSIEELQFNVSLVIGTNAASASLVQLKRLEQWAQENAFEFVAVDEGNARASDDRDSLQETRGMARVKEALECNMWASLQTVEKQPAVVPVTEPTAVNKDDAEASDEAPSKILVLGAELAEQHTVVNTLLKRSGAEGNTSTDTGETVRALTLATKYYTAEVEIHLHHVDTNELVTALQHDVDEYEALVWVVDASSVRSFKVAQQFVERSIEELTFEVSVVVGTHVDTASPAQVEVLEKWCQANGFEFVGVATTPIKAEAVDDGKQGIDRVLEVLHCNMWRSMKMLPRGTTATSASSPPPATASPSNDPVPLPLAIEDSASPPLPTEAKAADPLFHEARLQASFAALSGGGIMGDDDPDMEAFSGLLSQVQRIRASGAELSDEERRRQAERVAMQLWSMLGSDDDDEGGGNGGDDSD